MDKTVSVLIEKYGQTGAVEHLLKYSMSLECMLNNIRASLGEEPHDSIASVLNL